MNDYGRSVRRLFMVQHGWLFAKLSPAGLNLLRSRQFTRAIQASYFTIEWASFPGLDGEPIAGLTDLLSVSWLFASRPHHAWHSSVHRRRLASGVLRWSVYRACPVRNALAAATGTGFVAELFYTADAHQSLALQRLYGLMIEFAGLVGHIETGVRFSARRLSR